MQPHNLSAAHPTQQTMQLLRVPIAASMGKRIARSIAIAQVGHAPRRRRGWRKLGRQGLDGLFWGSQVA